MIAVMEVITSSSGRFHAELEEDSRDGSPKFLVRYFGPGEKLRGSLTHTGLRTAVRLAIDRVLEALKKYASYGPGP